MNPAPANHLFVIITAGLRLFNRELVEADKCHNVTFYLISPADMCGPELIWMGAILSAMCRLGFVPHASLNAPAQEFKEMIGLGSSRWQALATGEGGWMN